MPSNSQALAEKLDDRASSPVPASGAPTVRDLLLAQKQQIALALPKHLDIDRFMRLILTEARTNPKLLECSFETLMASVMQSAQLGLEPGPLGHAYLIPRYSKKRRQMECTFLIGYQGYIDLFRRAGVTIIARKVCENDTWEFYTDEHGDHMLHKPVDGDRGKPTKFYALATLPTGQRIVHVMSAADVAARRARSESADFGPWQTDPEAMSLKTVIRDVARWVPKSVTLEDALTVDRYADAPELMVPPDSVQPATGESRVELTDYTMVELAEGQPHLPDEPEGVWDDPDVAAPGDPKEDPI